MVIQFEEPKNRIARWLEALSQYDFTIEYRPGQRHGNADGMSRCPNIYDCKCNVEEPLKCGPCTKCAKRSSDMQSTLVPAEKLAANRIITCNVPLGESVKQRILIFVCLIFVWTVTMLSVLQCSLMNKLATHHHKNQLKLLVQRQKASMSELSTTYRQLFSTANCLKSTRNITTRSRGTWSLPYGTKHFQKLQLADPNISPVIKWIQHGPRHYGPEVRISGPELRHYWNSRDSLKLRDSLLYRKFTRKNGTGEYWQLIIPKTRKSCIKCITVYYLVI